MKTRRRVTNKQPSAAKKPKTTRIKRKTTKRRRVNQKGDGIFSVLVPLIATAISAAAARWTQRTSILRPVILAGYRKQMKTTMMVLLYRRLHFSHLQWLACFSLSYCWVHFNVNFSIINDVPTELYIRTWMMKMEQLYTKHDCKRTFNYVY